jgi:hypothetical protein
MKPRLALACRVWSVVVILSLSLVAQSQDFVCSYYRIGLSRTTPAFNAFALDSLGRGEVKANPVLAESATNSGIWRLATLAPGHFAYQRNGAADHSPPAWEVLCRERKLILRSRWNADTNLPPFQLAFNQKAKHATVLGLMRPGERRASLPCLLHLPDMGSARVTCNVADAKLDYDARRYVPVPFVSMAFPPASPEHPRVEYEMEVVAIYPHLAGIEQDPRFDGFRRSFLNIFQVNPRLGMLANNSSSDVCAFTVFKYSEVAMRAPPLAKGLTCLDLIRMTLDRYLAGTKGYGLTGYGKITDGADIIAWPTPYTSSDSYPSLLIAAGNYILGSRDWKWGRENYPRLAQWAREMLATDLNGNGLIEYPTSGNYGDRPSSERRPANWWDTINFGHEDAYSNALAYRALRLLADVARELRQVPDAQFYSEQAQRLRAAYVPAFLNLDSGILAGWRSADGRLHDYWFTFVSGVAITYGLVDDRIANRLMDKLLGKMIQVGYTNFALGLPGNLVPVRKGDYIFHDNPPEVFGVPRLEDGSDGFQYYENGGATACYAYFTVKALYQLGRTADARRIYNPMLRSYAAGEFQGFCGNGPSKDWRDWSGGCHGYEGFLVDSYLALLAAFDEVKTK